MLSHEQLVGVSAQGSVGGVGIHDQVNSLVLRSQLIDNGRKTQPFLMAVPVAQPLLCANIRSVQERLRLVERERVPDAHAVRPDASSGASGPLSAVSTASLRTAVTRTLIEIGPSPWASSATRQAVILGADWGSAKWRSLSENNED
jgi:hypothetical protein